MRFIYSYFRSIFITTPLFLRIIPTDRCNLRCEYCYQNDPNSPNMTKEEFDKYLSKAKKLGTSIISFLGGEPLIWPHIHHAIEQCYKNNIITDITTNATLLSTSNLNKLGEAGLDVLRISIDALVSSEQSKKSTGSNSALIKRLKLFSKKYSTFIQVNAVVTKQNIKSIEKLINFTDRLGYVISLGFVVPPPISGQKWSGSSFAFSEKDFPALQKFVDMILLKKKQGYKIVEPESYFKGIFDFVQGKNEWNCGDHFGRFSGVIIAPSGKLRSCTKLMGSLDYQFLKLTPKKIKHLRRYLVKRIIPKCNPICYSNCAYSAYYYHHHKTELVLGIISSIRKYRQKVRGLR
jgi:MoaA/NifB/PqqE/SkfB family radical SAM enzyme